MSVETGEFLELISCVYMILHLADGAGRLADAPAVIDELCELAALSERHREAVDKLVRTTVGY